MIISTILAAEVWHSWAAVSVQVLQQLVLVWVLVRLAVALWMP